MDRAAEIEMRPAINKLWGDVSGILEEQLKIVHKFNRAKEIIRGSRLLFFLLFPAIYMRRLVMRLRMRPLERYYDDFYEYTFDSVEEGSLVVTVPEFQGVFEIDFRSHLLKRVLKARQYEPEIVEVVKKYTDADKDVLDVGANIGFFSVLFSQLVSTNNRVVAIEPTPLALHYLRRNLQRNNCLSSVEIFEGVMTDTEGMVELRTVPGMEEYSSLGSIVESIGADPQVTSIEVYGSTLDKLVLDKSLQPGFIKIDTEGAEYLVLSGAKNTLEKYRPVILSELSDKYLATLGHTAKMVVNLLERNGYCVLNAKSVDEPIIFPFVGEILAVPKSSNLI